MRYKVGDRVRIKSIDWYNLHKRPLTKVVDLMNGPSFIKKMSCFCNKIMTIIANKELQDLLKQYPDDAIVCIEYCNIRELKYFEDRNLIVIE